MLLMFSSPSCAPCRMMKPTIESLAVERNYNVSIIDIVDDPELAKKHSIMATPTFLLEDDHGFELRRTVGAMTRPHLIKFVEGQDAKI